MATVYRSFDLETLHRHRSGEQRIRTGVSVRGLFVRERSNLVTYDSGCSYYSAVLDHERRRVHTSGKNRDFGLLSRGTPT